MSRPLSRLSVRGVSAMGGPGCHVELGVVVGWRGLPEVLQATPASFLLEAFLLLSPGNPCGDPRGRAVDQGQQTLAESNQGGCLVPELTPFLPCRHHQTGGKVGEANPALRPVLMLSPLSPGHEGLDPALGQELLVGLRDRKVAGWMGILFHRGKNGEFPAKSYGCGSLATVIFYD